MDESSEKDQALHPSLRAIFGVIVLGFIMAMVATVLPFFQVSKLNLLFGEILIGVPAVVYVRKKNFQFREVFRLHPVNKQVLTSTALLSVAVIVVIDELDRIITRFVQMPPEFEEGLQQLMVAESVMDWIVLILAAVFIAGVVEEMLFRGLLLKALENRVGVNQAIFLSAFIFAMVHPYPWLFQILILGVLLGYLTWRSGSILPSITLHCLTNGFSLLMENTGLFESSWYDWYGHVNPPVIAVAACAAFYSMKWFLRLTATDRPNMTAPGRPY